jgi:hypothetical protein
MNAPNAPTKLEVPAGHVLSTERDESGSLRLRFIELETGAVRFTDGSMAPADEQLRPSDKVVDRQRDKMLAHYAFHEQLQAYGTMHKVKKMSAPTGFRVLSMKEGFTDDRIGCRPTGKRLLDIGVADVHRDANLPNYAAGYSLAEGIADVLSSPIVTAKATNFYMTWDDINSFRRVKPNASAPGAGVPEVSISKTDARYVTVPYALAGFMPTEVETNADTPLRPFQKLVRRIMEALYLEREIRVSALLTTSANWDAGHVTTVAAGAKWNGGASSDPVRNIKNLMELSAQKVTGIGMSRQLYDIFTENQAVQKYIAYKTQVAPIPNPANIAALLDLPPIYVQEMKYYASGTTFSWPLGGHVVLFRQPPEMPPTSQDDVSTSATFRFLGGDSPDGTQQGGWIVRTFFMPDRGERGGRKVVVAHNDAEVMASKITGGLILNAYQ